jgi:phosphoserine phosphatase RsbU/P
MRLRVPLRARAGRRDAALPGTSPAPEPTPSAADLLLRSRAGLLFIAAAIVKLLVAIVRQIVTSPPAVVELVSGAATLGLIGSLCYFMWRLFVLAKRRLLWRVRRKLILSYLFIGAVPALLLVSFFLLSANFVSMNISAYLFKDAYDGVVEDIKLTAQSAAAQIAEDPSTAREVLQRIQTTVAQRYPRVAMALVPGGGAEASATAGRWDDRRPPRVLPSWLKPEGFSGTAAVPGDEPDELQLVIRAVHPSAGDVGWAVVDLPVDDFLMDSLRDTTGVKGITPRFSDSQSIKASVLIPISSQQADPTASSTFFGNSVAFLDTLIWTSGADRGATVSTRYDVSDLWSRLASVQSRRVQFVGKTLDQVFLMMLGLVAVLFLIIQGVALLMGLALARSITSSIHELFAGTERVRQGDFTHRIRVYTKDQLGELAESFNQMTGSIEGLLQTAAEKKRLEEELRIARQIQMSLLPRGPLDYSGIGVTALCVPAREVGGDYYDFFHLPGDRLGILIADVAGKGTSAALYMAELKGLMLALSQSIASPSALLREVNRIISENLDSRSFITMTYAVLDRPRLTMTYCRAGHTPLIYLPGPSSAASAGVKTLTPDGMVVGLRIPGASEKFDELLVEDCIDLSVGDVVVFYTDGITEAMNPQSDLFGEGRLGRIVEEHGHLDSTELRERILREIESFVGGADQHDDMTMILLKVEEAFVEAVAV